MHTHHLSWAGTEDEGFYPCEIILATYLPELGHWVSDAARKKQAHDHEHNCENCEIGVFYTVGIEAQSTIDTVRMPRVILDPVSVPRRVLGAPHPKILKI